MTLLEVMVALAVLAIALAAVVEAVGESTANLSRIRDRTFATWIADNVMAELRIGEAWATGTEEETRPYAGREWPLRVTIEDTQFPDVRRVEVEVLLPEDPEQVAGRMRGLLVNPELTAP